MKVLSAALAVFFVVTACQSRSGNDKLNSRAPAHLNQRSEESVHCSTDIPFVHTFVLKDGNCVSTHVFRAAYILSESESKSVALTPRVPEKRSRSELVVANVKDISFGEENHSFRIAQIPLHSASEIYLQHRPFLDKRLSKTLRVLAHTQAKVVFTEDIILNKQEPHNDQPMDWPNTTRELVFSFQGVTAKGNAVGLDMIKPNTVNIAGVFTARQKQAEQLLELGSRVIEYPLNFTKEEIVDFVGNYIKKSHNEKASRAYSARGYNCNVALMEVFQQIRKLENTPFLLGMVPAASIEKTYRKKDLLMRTATGSVIKKDWCIEREYLQHFDPELLSTRNRKVALCP